MQGKLSANHDHYPTESLRMGYVENQVGGAASKHLALRLRERSTNAFTSADELFEVLERVYADPNRRHTALTEFRKLYQANKNLMRSGQNFSLWQLSWTSLKRP